MATAPAPAAESSQSGEQVTDYSDLDPFNLTAAGHEFTFYPHGQDRLKALVDESIGRGIFGAPTIFVDGEMFWGHDRLPQVERWLATGPF
jgi:2-hydroxychromene-2-carboxylate isomerase